MTEIDAVDLFEAYADSQDWRFAYGTKEILNVEVSRADLTNGEIMMLMFPFEERGQFNSTIGILSAWEIGTQIWIGRKFDTDSSSGTLSKLDETMKQKYDRRLLTLRGLVREMIKTLFCDASSELTSIKIGREINVTNENLDFIMVDLTFKHE